MKCSVHIFLINDLFSEEIAERDHGGEESPENRRFQWEDEFEITVPVSDINVIENGSYSLRGSYPDGKAFEEIVGGMRLFEIKTAQGINVVACSESLLDTYELSKLEHEFVLSIFLKDNEPLANPITGIYIATGEFPDALIDG